MPQQGTQAAVADYLAENRQYSPLLLGGSICNHYSMALLAALELGADEHDLHQMHHNMDARYRDPIVDHATWSKQLVDQDTWEQQLGTGAIGVHRQFFSIEMATRGLQCVLERYLPHLLLGQHKGLFHPIIRLCFAIRAPDGAREAEVVEALAYSASRHQSIYDAASQDFPCLARASTKQLSAAASLESSLPPVDVVELEQRLHGVLDHARTAFSARSFDGQGNSFQILAELYRSERIRELCAEWSLQAADASDAMLLLTETAIQVYAYQPGLTTLHAVTGAHALFEIQKHLPPQVTRASVKLYFHWLMTLFIEKGAPDILPRSDCEDGESGPEKWVDLRAAALAPLRRGRMVGGGDAGESVEMHVVKLAMTCDVMNQISSHPLYFRVAEFVVSNNRPW